MLDFALLLQVTIENVVKLFFHETVKGTTEHARGKLRTQQSCKGSISSCCVKLGVTINDSKAPKRIRKINPHMHSHTQQKQINI